MDSRFWGRVNRTTGCWLFAGAVSSSGYGSVVRSGKTYTAHRYAWLDTFGCLPGPSVFLCHTCDVKLCVNPDHLYEGSRSDNARDMWSRGRARHKPSAISATDLRILRGRGMLQREVAEMVGVSQVRISQIERSVEQA